MQGNAEMGVRACEILHGSDAISDMAFSPY